MTLLEVCVESVASFRAAVDGGAGRVELCSALSVGGLTPSLGLLRRVKCQPLPTVPVFVMVRPRDGDFVYSDPEELAVMEEDVVRLRDAGADGFVFGVLTADGRVDSQACRRLLDKAGPLPCTFHRAIDVAADPFDALETVIELGFKRVLTSGQQASAEQGVDMLRRLRQRAGDRIVVMAGAGVTAANARLIVDGAGVSEVHGSASRFVSNAAGSVSMGHQPESLQRRVTCQQIVADMVRAIR